METQQAADDLDVGTAGPTFERPRVPPRPPSPQPTNAVGEQAWQMRPAVAVARALRTVEGVMRETMQEEQMFSLLKARAWRQGESFAAWNAAITCSALGRRKVCFKWLCNSYKKSGEDLSAIALCYATGYGVRKDVAKAEAMLAGMKSQHNVATDQTRLALTLLARLRQGVCIEISEPITRMMDGLCTRG